MRAGARTLKIRAALKTLGGGYRYHRYHKSILKEINPAYSLEGLKLKLQYFGHLMQRADSLEKTLMLGKTEGRTRKGATEDEMVGWHHRLDGHELEQTLEDGPGSLACCCPWGCRDSGMI